MQRRNFLKLTTAATSALLLSTIAQNTLGKERFINIPDEAWAKAGGEWFKLKRSGNEFSYQDISVTLQEKSQAKAVLIRSPKLELHSIRLTWTYKLPSGSAFLGDHWERSYGDLGWKKKFEGVVNPWYVLVHDGRQTAGFGVKTGCNAFCSWQLGLDKLTLDLDTTSGGKGVLLHQRELHAADLIVTDQLIGENVFTTARRFCGMMCSDPLLPKQPIYGINDWYYAYGNNSFDSVKLSTHLISELVSSTDNRPYSVVDAGWAAYSPVLPGDGSWNEDFSKPNDKFRDMHLLADEIKKSGMRPGLWMRPLCAKHDDKPSLLAPKIPGRDDPKRPVLDPTIPENIARIQDYFKVYKNWGFEMVKHDFSSYDITGRWGFEMVDSITSPGWSFNDRSKTTAEIILDLYRSIREAAGDICIIGCNTMSHLSAGIFEICRIGDDTSGKEWARTRKMGVNTLAYRLTQHNTFYAADGDCVGLTTEIPWKKNKQWLTLLARSGSPFFISAQPEALGAEQRKAIKEAFIHSAKVQPVGEPLDWLHNPLPETWKLNNETVHFNWA